MAKTELVGAGALKAGQMKKITAGGTDFLVARLEDGFYVLANKCPHLGGALADGLLEGTVVRCPRHGARYDVRTGENLGEATLLFIKMKPGPATSYPVTEENGLLYVELD